MSVAPKVLGKVLSTKVKDLTLNFLRDYCDLPPAEIENIADEIAAQAARKVETSLTK
jgi:hypothetical protein